MSTHDERIQSLEEGRQESISRDQALQDTMDEILRRLNNVPTEPRVAPVPQNTPVLDSLGGPTSRRLKPSPPSEFDGNRDKGRAFINSCKLYIALCKSEFTDDQVTIHWVLSFMKSGRAAVYANRLLRSEERWGVSRFASFDAFRTEFVATFCPENEATDSIMRLESAKYFQGKRTVDEYVDEFMELVDLSG